MLKNIVLDMDNMLIRTYTKDKKYQKLYEMGIMNDSRLLALRDQIISFKLHDVNRKRGVGYDYNMWAIKRPHLDEFLIFCFEHFDNVIIWSAGQKEYVDCLIEKIFDPLRGIPEPKYVFTRNDCVNIRKNSKIPTKPLEIICNHENFKGVVTLENTWLLDDLEINFVKNHSNGILIPAYIPECNINNIVELNKKDDYLLKFINWCKENDIHSLKNDKDKTYGKHIFEE